MIIHYIMKEIMFVVIIYMLLAQKRKLKSHVKYCFKIKGKQMIKMPNNGNNTLDSKIIKEKKNHHLWFIQIFKII